MLIMGKWHTRWATVLLLFIISCVYYTYLVSQVGSIKPGLIYEAMQEDTASYGIWAFIIDFIFLVGVIMFIRYRRAKKEESDSIWKTSQNFGPLLLDDTPVYYPPPPSPEEVKLLNILEDENL
jgi:cbb3-type cytochrome oxidase subunit 3